MHAAVPATGRLGVARTGAGCLQNHSYCFAGDRADSYCDSRGSIASRSESPTRL